MPRHPITHQGDRQEGKKNINRLVRSSLRGRPKLNIPSRGDDAGGGDVTLNFVSRGNAQQ